MARRRKSSGDIQPIGIGMTNARAMRKRKNLINVEKLLEIEPLTDNQTKLFDSFDEGKNLVAYGAAAKGNTFLNYAGIQPDLLPVVFDASKSKQNKFS